MSENNFDTTKALGGVLCALHKLTNNKAYEHIDFETFQINREELEKWYKNHLMIQGRRLRKNKYPKWRENALFKLSEEEIEALEDYYLELYGNTN